MEIIPFYGATDPELFSLERRAMDRAGLVATALERRLPVRGRVLDIGAGDGHLARRLATPHRLLVAVEPALGMIRSGGDAVEWIRGGAAHLPLRDGSADAAYATWAYFFSRGWDPGPGLGELHRVVRPGGPLLVADNLGGDQFCALADRDITADPAYWEAQGFACEVIETAFEFDDLAGAVTLLGAFFGERGRSGAALRLSFRVGLFCGESRGPGGN